MRRNQPPDQTYVGLVAFFCALLVAGNGVAAKIFRVPFYPSLGLPMGLITYPLTFLITDIIAEVYGPRRANFAVILGLFTSLAMLAVVQTAVLLPGHPAWLVENNAFGYATLEEQETAYFSVFFLNRWAVLGSMTAYLAAQLVDIQVFHRLRLLTKGRHLWLRNILSTLSSQVVDTVIVNVLVLVLGMGIGIREVVPMILGAYAYKAVFALLDTPFCYLGVYLIRSRCQEKLSPSKLTTFTTSQK